MQEVPVEMICDFETTSQRDFLKTPVFKQQKNRKKNKNIVYYFYRLCIFPVKQMKCIVCLGQLSALVKNVFFHRMSVIFFY